MHLIRFVVLLIFGLIAIGAGLLLFSIASQSATGTPASTITAPQ